MAGTHKATTLSMMFHFIDSYTIVMDRQPALFDADLLQKEFHNASKQTFRTESDKRRRSTAHLPFRHFIEQAIYG